MLAARISLKAIRIGQCRAPTLAETASSSAGTMSFRRGPRRRSRSHDYRCHYYNALARATNDGSNSKSEDATKAYVRESSSTSTSTSTSAASARVRMFGTAGLPHDAGGECSAYGSLASKIENPDDLQDWEVRCHALFSILASSPKTPSLTTDGLRRSIEALSPSQYSSWTYYEKWTAGMTSLLLEGGMVTTFDLERALFGRELASSSLSPSTADVARSEEPRFETGDYVKVRPYRSDGTGIEWRRPHIRVPGYIYGARGVVERVCGVHDDPSFLAFGIDAPKVRLYRVRFRMKDVWPERHRRDDSDDADNSDGDDDVIEVEVYEPWLEPSVESSGHEIDGVEGVLLFDHSKSGSDCMNDVTGDHHNHHHHDRHHHHHHDDDNEGDHSHDPRPLVEERAARLEGEPRPGKELFFALMNILIEKGIVTPEEVRAMSEKLVTAGKTLHGASLIARAWTDPDFEHRLLDDAPSAAAELGIVTANPNAPTVLTVVKNTREVHNLVVCTLCSCYPGGLLGIAPSWYKSREYRSRAVREPRRVLAEFGTTLLPKGKSIRVHDSTADHRYLVLPERPVGTEGWTEEELRTLVTRDCMVGVALPRIPAT